MQRNTFDWNRFYVRVTSYSSKVDTMCPNLFEPVLSMSSLFNEVYYLFDFGLSRYTFKKYIRNINQGMNQ